MKIQEVQCKSILTKSGLADYCLNCYIGCQHGCRYCYAMFMAGYTNHKEPWGEFVDVKINAAEVLAKEVKKKRPAEVFISSVCDGWQPLEAKYKLTRTCLEILLKNDFSITILTKSSLIERDLDLLSLYPSKVHLGFTLTTLDARLRWLFEPMASSVFSRIAILKKAAKLGIKNYVFLGPLFPYLSDKESDIEALFCALQGIDLEFIYLDRLNPRSGVWMRLLPILRSYYPQLIAKYKAVLFDKNACQLYSISLAKKAKNVAQRLRMLDKLRICF